MTSTTALSFWSDLTQKAELSLEESNAQLAGELGHVAMFQNACKGLSTRLQVRGYQGRPQNAVLTLWFWGPTLVWPLQLTAYAHILQCSETRT